MIIQPLSKILYNVPHAGISFYTAHELSPLQNMVTSRAIISSIQKQLYYEIFDVPTLISAIKHFSEVNNMECLFMWLGFFGIASYIQINYLRMSKIDSKLSTLDYFVSTRQKVQFIFLFVVLVLFRGVENAI